VLSKLPADVVERAIASGVVHAELKLAEARHILRSAQANAAAPEHTPKPFDLAGQRARLLRYLRQQFARWPLEYDRELADLLEAMAVELRTNGSGT
jgi:hypothetical protein